MRKACGFLRAFSANLDQYTSCYIRPSYTHMVSINNNKKKLKTASIKNLYVKEVFMRKGQSQIRLFFRNNKKHLFL